LAPVPAAGMGRVLGATLVVALWENSRHLDRATLVVALWENSRHLDRATLVVAL
jgi:hypothetical protein